METSWNVPSGGTLYLESAPTGDAFQSHHPVGAENLTKNPATCLWRLEVASSHAGDPGEADCPCRGSIFRGGTRPPRLLQGPHSLGLVRPQDRDGDSRGGRQERREA